MKSETDQAKYLPGRGENIWTTSQAEMSAPLLNIPEDSSFVRQQQTTLVFKRFTV